MKLDDLAFREFAAVLPQPIAQACGRIVRARSSHEIVDALLKCSEVLARYLAAATMASFSARDDGQLPVPKGLDKFCGDLAFGHFLGLVQLITAEGCANPLKPYLDAGFQARKGRQGPSDEALVGLVKLRNDLGHDLMNLSEAKARGVLIKRSPDALVLAALRGVEGLLRLPLFIIEQQEYAKKRVTARRLLLMGEPADPMPEDIELSAQVENPGQPYLGVPGGALSLYPFLMWDIASERATFGVYFLDSIASQRTTYVTLQDESLSDEGDVVADLLGRLSGDRSPVESVSLKSGKDFSREWADRKLAIEQARTDAAAVIPWDQFNRASLERYGSWLEFEGTERQIRKVIQERLLDGRDVLDAPELRQLLLLFGVEEVVRSLLRRVVVDLRARKRERGRFIERIEPTGNIIDSLHVAIDFLGRHIGVDGITLDGLQATAGSADYIALREGLANLFVHQDYGDQRTVGQVDLSLEHATLFNPGDSLVPSEELFEGQRSQLRNPLIARALRLVGFAEHAGSGLREVERIWLGARRRLPIVQSDERSNTFTLKLDWRPLPDAAVYFWKHRMGANVMPLEADVLRVVAQTGGQMVLTALATELGVHRDDAEAAVRSLSGQALASISGDTVAIPDYVMNVAMEAVGPGSPDASTP